MSILNFNKYTYLKKNACLRWFLINQSYKAKVKSQRALNSGSWPMNIKIAENKIIII